MKIRSSRRAFLKSTLIASAGPLILSASARGAEGRPAPSERVTVGCIGVGSRGTYVMGSTLELPEAQVLAVCDVKRDVREAAQRLVNERYGNTDCAAYNDFRELVARDDLDAVLVCSTDHWHVLHALTVVRSGKDVFVEKPLGLTVAESQALRAEVRQRDRVFQFGTQQRSSDIFRRACELVRNERIGTLRTVRAWSPASASGGPLELVPPPETLDYDLWLGPAPEVPHTMDRTSNQWWWFNSDYAIGFIAGWGIHPVDIALWGAGERMQGPFEVEGTGEFSRDGICDTATQWGVTVRYDSGIVMDFRSQPAPTEWAQRYGDVTDHGTAFEGDDGWVCVDRRRMWTSPPELANEPVDPGGIRLYESRHHMRNFLDCVKSREETISPIDEAVRSDILCHVCNIALRRGGRLRWDPATERFTNDDTANRYLSRAQRSPWHL